MAIGRVVKFDSVRGFGFIAPDYGGEDVFLHVNDLLIPEHYLRAGLTVEFDVEDGERGPKASAVRLAKDGDAVEAPPVPKPVGLVTAESGPAEGDDTMCEVLSVSELTRELTELLLGSMPSLTGEQILHVRREVIRLARKYGWIEG